MRSAGGSDSDVSFSVRLKREALQDLKRLPRDAQLRILFAIGLVSHAPTRPSPRLSIKQMRGHAGFWRLAVGPWRGVYHFDGEVVRFYMFGHRATIYQQFEART
jgi:mRNA-degrading endonuclease RelE of RelBE toxin-antitoxin system